MSLPPVLSQMGHGQDQWGGGTQGQLKISHGSSDSAGVHQQGPWVVSSRRGSHVLEVTLPHPGLSAPHFLFCPALCLPLNSVS